MNKGNEIKRSHSIGHSLVRGLGWGLLLVVLNGIGFQGMLAVSGYIEAMLYGKGEWRIPLGQMLPGIYLAYLFLGLKYFSVPSVAGGCVLALILHRLVPGHSLPGRVGLWAGIAVGSAVALGGLIWFFVAERSDNWIFAVFVCAWEMYAYAWLGRRLALSY
jgi:hypothetical protein